MKISSTAELLIPTVQFGNVKLCMTVGLDTVTDQENIAEAIKTHGLAGSVTSNETVAQAAREIAVSEIRKMKAQIDKLAADTYTKPPTL